jgi:hypothetical protein
VPFIPDYIHLSALLPLYRPGIPISDTFIAIDGIFLPIYKKKLKKNTRKV